MLIQCWLNVGPASTTLTQHWLTQCWPSVYSAGPTLSQPCVNALCFLGKRWFIECCDLFSKQSSSVRPERDLWWEHSGDDYDVDDHHRGVSYCTRPWSSPRTPGAVPRGAARPQPVWSSQINTPFDRLPAVTAPRGCVHRLELLKAPYRLERTVTCTFSRPSKNDVHRKRFCL